MDKRPDGSKATATRSLAEGLGLHRGQGRFMLMTEAKSGLRYVRRSEDIFNNGLSVSLEGFQCQVFIDMTEIQDDETGSYSALCDSLGGGGVPDIGWALQDMALAELYRSWKTAFSPDFFRLIEAVPTAVATTAGAGTGTKAAMNRESLVKLLSTAARFAAGATPEAGKPGNARLEAMAAACMAAAKTALALLHTGALAPMKGKQASGLAGLSARIKATPAAAETITALIALLPIAQISGTYADSTKAQSLAESWGMARKLREALVAAGTDYGTADKAGSFAVAALGRLELVAGAGPARLSRLDPGIAAGALLADDEARALLGVNRWNGETWIDADRYRLAATVLAAAAVALGDADALRVEKTLVGLDAALLDAGWSLDRVVAAAETAIPKAPKKRPGKE